MASDSGSLAPVFRAAHYRALGRPAFTARCGRVCPGLRAWMRRSGATTAAVLTAHNPGGRRRGARANAAAQARLEAALRALRPLALRRGRNEDPAGRWPPEPSVWVLGLRRAQALALARRFGQAAILHSGPSARPRLAWAAK